MGSLLEECSSELQRFDWRQKLVWFHRLSPILVAQALLVLSVIKSGCVWFDVMGIINFNLFLLLTVTIFHLLIWEIMSFTRKSVRDNLRIISGWNTKMLEEHTQIPRQPPQVNKRNGPGFQILTPQAEVKPASRSVDVEIQTEVTAVNPESVKSGDLTRCMSSASLASLSSSVCVIPDASSSSESASFCVVSTCSSSMGSSYSSSCSGTYSDSFSSTTETDDSFNGKIDDNKMPFIDHEVKFLPSHAYANTCDLKNTNNMVDSNRLPSIPPLNNHIDHEALAPTPVTGTQTHKATSRLKLLQDIYIVVDVFKSLVCLDSMRHLWFYYSIYYWRMSIFQTIEIFLVPSLVVFFEVSLTVASYIP